MLGAEVCASAPDLFSDYNTPIIFSALLTLSLISLMVELEFPFLIVDITIVRH